MDTRQRKLGLIETQMASMHELARGTTQGSEMISIRGCFPLQNLVKAAELLFRKYAISQCAINYLEGDYWLVQHGEFERIEIRQKFLSNSEKFWHCYEESTNEPLQADYALWRLLLLSSADGKEHRLIVTSHQVMLDASGYDQFTRDLLGFMEALAKGERVLPDPLGIPSAVDDFLSDQPGGLDVHDTVCPMLTYHRNTELENRKTKVLNFELSAREYHALDLQCRADGVSVSTYMVGLFVCLTRKSGLSGKSVMVRSAVSLRARLKSQKDYLNQLGCYISMVDTPVDYGQVPIPVLVAKNYQNTLFPYIFHNCYRRKDTETNRIRREVKSLQGSAGFEQGLSFFNRGVVEIGTQYHNFTITDYDSASCCQAGNTACQLHILQFCGRLKCNLVYTWPLASHEQIGAIRKRLHASLLEYCLAERRLAV